VCQGHGLADFVRLARRHLVGAEVNRATGDAVGPVHVEVGWQCDSAVAGVDGG
jgi:hypothetical protein